MTSAADADAAGDAPAEPSPRNEAEARPEAPRSEWARLRGADLPKRPPNLPQRVDAPPEGLDPEVVEGAADTLLNGGVIALATDTVYGLAADASNSQAVERLYSLKGRGGDVPIPLMIGDMRMLQRLTPIRDDEPLAFLNLVWPGPLTAVLSKYPDAFAAATAEDSLAVRMPDHPVTLAVLRSFRRPLAVTSANLAGAPPATNADALDEGIAESVDLILDSGSTPGPIPSTVLDMTERPYRVLREGVLTLDDLRQRLGAEAVVVDGGDQ